MLPVASLEKDYIVATHCEGQNCVLVVLAAENEITVKVKLRISEGLKASYDNADYDDGDEIEVG